MRRLIVCADGTWNRPDQTSGGVEAPTNVVKLARAIAPVDSGGVSQIVHYERGVGTHNAEDTLFGGAFGQGLDDNIRDCYRFLMQNYALATSCISLASAAVPIRSAVSPACFATRDS